jgi:hypothetical protein
MSRNKYQANIFEIFLNPPTIRRKMGSFSKPTAKGGRRWNCLTNFLAHMLVFVYHCFDRVAIKGIYLSYHNQKTSSTSFAKLSLPSVTQ